jgi:ArsR family metal-binding transcriptional regulator
MNYKVEYSEGCFFSLTINGEETAEFTDKLEELRKVCKAIMDKCTDITAFQEFLQYALMDMGEYIDDGYCEQCGSSNYSYRLDIDIDD